MDAQIELRAALARIASLLCPTPEKEERGCDGASFYDMRPR
jgi:hypothetical protein